MHSPSDATEFEEIVLHLQQTRGFDFTAYKRSSLMRRVLKRMQTVDVGSFDAYLDFLQVHQEEFAALFNTILINVTAFYRDPLVWDYLAREVLPPLLSQSNDHFRVWSAGCASGQEPYTAAIVLAELLGPDAFRERVKIYATDIDEDALSAARTGVYLERQLENVPPELVEKYFDHNGHSRTFKRDFRRSVIFGRHDLHQDAPISRVDLLLCRNTLMYFNAEAQARTLAKFFFSLKPGGHVLLGRAEMLLSPGAMFTPVDLKRRLFRAVPKPNSRDRLLLMAQTGRDVIGTSSAPSRLREMAFESDVLLQFIVDPSGTVIAATAAARQRLAIGPRDIGRRVQDLGVFYRLVELRDALNRAVRDSSAVQIRDVEWTDGSDIRYFDIDLAPIQDDEGTVLGTRVTFTDVTELKWLKAELQQSKREVETAYEELQSTNEELESTNEELQTTVEELETTNEELQSTNEELETMNEELQSTNEELQTMNEELHNRSTELNSTAAFLESVFTSLGSAVIVVDHDLRIQVWNARATDLWGARPEEAQSAYLPNLDIGLPVASLRDPVQGVLSGTKDFDDVVLPAITRKGKPFECRVNITPLRQLDGSVAGVILLMEARTG